MTYLIPDDWYANHGLAPGDARLPQGVLQPLPGNMAATPPMRGYYGPRPPQPPPSSATISPWAVSDVMWGNSPPPPGVSGLGVAVVPQPVYVVHRPGRTLRQVGTKVAADLIAAGVLSSLGAVRIPPLASRAMRAQLAGLGCPCAGPPRQLGGPLGDGAADASATIAAAEKKMKAEIMEVAATNLAIGIGLACIPVVGWAIGLIYSLITTITEAKYQRAAQKVMADLQVQLQQFAGNLDQQMATLQGQVFDANKAAGVALATSSTPLPSNVNATTCVVSNPPAAPAAASAASGQLPSPAASVASTVGLASNQAATPAPAPAVPVNGLGSVFSSINTQIQRATSATDQALRTAGTAVADVAKAITGKDILDRARAAAATAFTQASAQMQAQYNTAAANVQSPAYAQALVLVIACRCRQDPSIAQMLMQTTDLEVAAGSDTSAFGAAVSVGKIPQTALMTGAAAAGAVLLVGILGAR
jgi:hypothetical protein